MDAFREDEVDTVDSELSPDTEMLELEPDELEISPDAEVTPDTNNPDAELAEAEADTEKDRKAGNKNLRRHKIRKQNLINRKSSLKMKYSRIRRATAKNLPLKNKSRNFRKMT